MVVLQAVGDAECLISTGNSWCLCHRPVQMSLVRIAGDNGGACSEESVVIVAQRINSAMTTLRLSVMTAAQVVPIP